MRTGLITSGSNPAHQRASAPTPPGQEGPDLLDDLLDLFTGSSQESDAPLSQALVDKATKRYRGNFRRAVEDDRGLPTPIVQLDRLLRAKTIADDPDHKLADRVNRQKLEANLTKVTRDQDLQKRLDRMRADSVDQAGATGPLEKQKAYLTGSQFHDKLAQLSPQEAAAVMAQELGKVTSLDPDAAGDISRTILDNSAAQAFKHLHKSDRSRIADGLVAASTVADVQTLSREDAKVVADLILSAEDVGQLASTGQNITQIANGLKRHAPDKLNQALGWVAKADEAGMLSSVLVGTSLVTAFSNELETDSDKVKFASDLLQAGGSVSQMTHLPFLAGALQHGQVADMLLTTSQVIGPVGTALSTVVSSYGAFKALEEGDNGKAAGHGLIATGSALMLSAAFLPAAAPLVLYGAGTSLTGLAVSLIWGKSPDEKLLEDAGLLLPKQG